MGHDVEMSNMSHPATIDVTGALVLVPADEKKWRNQLACFTVKVLFPYLNQFKSDEAMSYIADPYHLSVSLDVKLPSQNAAEKYLRSELIDLFISRQLANEHQYTLHKMVKALMEVFSLLRQINVTPAERQTALAKWIATLQLVPVGNTEHANPAVSNDNVKQAVTNLVADCQNGSALVQKQFHGVAVQLDLAGTQNNINVYYKPVRRYEVGAGLSTLGIAGLGLLLGASLTNPIGLVIGMAVLACVGVYSVYKSIMNKKYNAAYGQKIGSIKGSIESGSNTSDMQCQLGNARGNKLDAGQTTKIRTTEFNPLSNHSSIRFHQPVNQSVKKSMTREEEMQDILQRSFINTL